MSLQTLLSVLADGEFHSGDELGRLLGVSRTAVWKQLKKIDELGLPFESVKGKGYCLSGGLDLLDLTVIQEALSPIADTLISHIDVLDVVDSTNTRAMSKAMPGNSGYVCTAEQQTAGRGRRGRNWVSPYASNLYLSVVWEFSGGAASLEGLSLAVGVSVLEALQQFGVSDACLKWPNDVLYQGKKLSGVLLEMVGDASGPCQVVIGIGVNVAMDEKRAREIDQPWVNVQAITDQSIARNILLAELLNRLMPMLAEFERLGFSAYQQRWQQLDAYAGQEVALTIGEQVLVGIASGVDDSGAIIIDTSSGRQRFSGGEVSLRAKG